MKKFLNTKTIVGSLVVGIIGSALWENIFRGLFNFCSKTLLTISTLGVEKYKDNIYINIAKGFYEQISIQILSLIFSILFGILIAMIQVIFKIRRDKDESHESRAEKWLRVRNRFVRTGFLVYTIFVIGVSILSLTKMTYINKSIAYFIQLESIAAPYLSIDQEELFDARFALIQNKKDYTMLIEDLSSVIVGAGQNLPKRPSFIF